MKNKYNIIYNGKYTIKLKFKTNNNGKKYKMEEICNNVIQAKQSKSNYLL